MLHLPTKTRSDLLLSVIKCSEQSEDQDKIYLIKQMHKKIENAYKIVFGLEKDTHFKELGELLRKALES
jgi:hypothetical protein